MHNILNVFKLINVTEKHFLHKFFCLNTYRQEYLQGRMSHLDELKVHQTVRYRYISVVCRCPGWWGADECHSAPRAVLHPPGAVHGQVKRQDKVRVLARQRETGGELNYIL